MLDLIVLSVKSSCIEVSLMNVPSLRDYDSFQLIVPLFLQLNLLLKDIRLPLSLQKLMCYHSSVSFQIGNTPLNFLSTHLHGVTEISLIVHIMKYGFFLFIDISKLTMCLLKLMG